MNKIRLLILSNLGSAVLTTWFLIVAFHKSSPRHHRSLIDECCSCPTDRTIAIQELEDTLSLLKKDYEDILYAQRSESVNCPTLNPAQNDLSLRQLAEQEIGLVENIDGTYRACEIQSLSLVLQMELWVENTTNFFDCHVASTMLLAERLCVPQQETITVTFASTFDNLVESVQKLLFDDAAENDGDDQRRSLQLATTLYEELADLALDYFIGETISAVKDFLVAKTEQNLGCKLGGFNPCILDCPAQMILIAAIEFAGIYTGVQTGRWMFSVANDIFLDSSSPTCTTCLEEFGNGQIPFEELCDECEFDPTAIDAVVDPCMYGNPACCGFPPPEFAAEEYIGAFQSNCDGLKLCIICAACGPSLFCNPATQGPNCGCTQPGAFYDSVDCFRDCGLITGCER